jgi:hypothetical protein
MSAFAHAPPNDAPQAAWCNLNDDAVDTILHVAVRVQYDAQAKATRRRIITKFGGVLPRYTDVTTLRKFSSVCRQWHTVCAAATNWPPCMVSLEHGIRLRTRYNLPINAEWRNNVIDARTVCDRVCTQLPNVNTVAMTGGHVGDTLEVPVGTRHVNIRASTTWPVSKAEQRRAKAMLPFKIAPSDNWRTLVTLTIQIPKFNPRNFPCLSEMLCTKKVDFRGCLPVTGDDHRARMAIGDTSHPPSDTFQLPPNVEHVALGLFAVGGPVRLSPASLSSLTLLIGGEMHWVEATLAGMPTTKYVSMRWAGAACHVMHVMVPATNTLTLQGIVPRDIAPTVGTLVIVAHAATGTHVQLPAPLHHVQTLVFEGSHTVAHSLMQRCANAINIAVECPSSEVTGTTEPDDTPTFVGHGFSHRTVLNLALRVGSLGRLPLWVIVAAFPSIQALHLDLTGTTFPPTATAWPLPTGRGLREVQNACQDRLVSIYSDAAAAVHTPPARIAELRTIFPRLVETNSASPSWVEAAQLSAMRVL